MGFKIGMLLCRAEQQRNEALLNVEELTRAFKKYKEKITEKLEKVGVFSSLVFAMLLGFCFFQLAGQQTATGSPVGQLFLPVSGKVLSEMGQGKQLFVVITSVTQF